MKMILLAASLLALGGVANAQDAMQPPAGAPAPADPAMAPPAAPADPAMAAPAAAPADPAMAAPAMTDESNLPICSKTVTDKCKQGGAPHRKMIHHKTMM